MTYIKDMKLQAEDGQGTYTAEELMTRAETTTKPAFWTRKMHGDNCPNKKKRLWQ